MNDRNTLIAFSVSDAAIATLRDEYMGLTIAGVDDVAGFKRVHSARINVKDKRVSVEKTRKELKADALKFGQTVDAEARRLTSLLEPIEAHLESEESRIQKEKEAIKNAARLQAEAEAKAKAEAERQAFLDEQRKQAEQRAALDAERAALEAEKKRIADEAAAIQAEKDRAARVERERQEAEESEKRRIAEAEQAKIRAEKERVEREERERKHAEEVAKARKEASEKAAAETEARMKREAADRAEAAKRKAEASEKARIRKENMRPDREKLESVARQLRTIVFPSVGKASQVTASRIALLVNDAASSIEAIIEEEFA